MIILKLSAFEIETKVSEHLLLAGRSFGNNYFHLLKAENFAKQHPDYLSKYKLTFDLIKSIYK